MRVAIAGNPNSGKSSLFNALTGSRARVGNYAGVTVATREAPMGAAVASNNAVGDGADLVTLVDLPGCYSLTARSAEEDLSQRLLLGDVGTQPCQRVVCVVDMTQMGRGLYLLLQLRELGLPCVVALTMSDIAASRGLAVNLDSLAQLLGVEVIACSARTGQGLGKLRAALAAPIIASPPYPGLLSTLTPAERAALAPVATALLQQKAGIMAPQPHSLALWLVTSKLSALNLTLGEPLRAAVAAAQAAVDPHGSGAFGRATIGARFRAVDAIVRTVQAQRPQADPRTQAIDAVLLHPIAGSAILVVLLFVVFQAVFAWAQPMMDRIGAAMAWLSGWVMDVVPPSLTQSLLVHGVLAGVGNILTFVPQIALLFFCLALLEESGYMARAALLLDRIMRRVGLNGRAFIPLMSSFACAVPGIMAARTLARPRDRLVTMLIAPLMGCSARLPVYTLVVAATFAQAPPLLGFISVGGVVILSMYVLGFVAALATASLLRRTALPDTFAAMAMELPAYRLPQADSVLRHVLAKCMSFVTGTGGTILLLSVLLWATLTFPRLPETLQSHPPAASEMAADSVAPAAAPPEASLQARKLEHAWAGRLGHAIEPVIAPLGFDWRIGVGLLASFAAREVLISTLTQVYALDAGSDSVTLTQALRDDIDPKTGTQRFTQLKGLSLMVFFVLAMQCMSTLAVLRRETGGWRWPLVALVYMNGLAYLASLCVFQGGLWLGYG